MNGRLAFLRLHTLEVTVISATDNMNTLSGNCFENSSPVFVSLLYTSAAFISQCDSWVTIIHGLPTKDTFNTHFNDISENINQNTNLTEISTLFYCKLDLINNHLADTLYRLLLLNQPARLTN